MTIETDSFFVSIETPYHTIRFLLKTPARPRVILYVVPCVIVLSITVPFHFKYYLIICQDIQRFKKIRQWLFNLGYIQYIVNGEIWTHDNCNPIQLTHFRASRPCYVNLVKPFDAQDVEDDKDEFLDYIENCDGK